MLKVNVEPTVQAGVKRTVSASAAAAGCVAAFAVVVWRRRVEVVAAMVRAAAAVRRRRGVDGRVRVVMAWFLCGFLLLIFGVFAVCVCWVMVKCCAVSFMALWGWKLGLMVEDEGLSLGGWVFRGV